MGTLFSSPPGNSAPCSLDSTVLQSEWAINMSDETAKATDDVPESGGVPKPETPQTEDQNLTEEAADFITSQVLDKGATFFGG
jgi:hypothetical protein